MSFFGFEQSGLEKEKQKILDSGLQASEDLTVYTWGEESYDGLGDALQEGGDELNDETFGNLGQVGKDFDFGQQSLPPDVTPQAQPELASEPFPSHETLFTNQPSRETHLSLESIWDEKSPFSVLPRTNGSGTSRISDIQASGTGPFSPFQADNGIAQQSITHGVTQTGVQTLQEIEAEMRAAAQLQSRAAAADRQLRAAQQYQQQQVLDQQQQQQIQQEQLRQEQIRKLQLLQQQQHQSRSTPPPRMMPTTQAPRFQERQQRQIMLLQQQQFEIQQQQRLQELQEQARLERLQQQQLELQELQAQQQHIQELHEQARLEKLERRLLAQQLSQLRQQSPSNLGQPRYPSGSSVAELQASPLMQQQQQRRSSPALNDTRFSLPKNMSYSPHNVQMQQRLLAEMAQAEFLRDMQGGRPGDHEALRSEAVRKIMEAERMEEKRRRKASKLAHMSRYNDLMTQSDKDFITRIQVSQLVTQDPYAEDFYAQVYSSIVRSRLGMQSQDERVLKFGSSGGIALGPGQKGGNRRPSAMQRMEAQVERIVNNSRLREKEKGLHALHSLQGALGKTAGRSYKAAPRQLLQVEGATNSQSMSPAHVHISKLDAQKNGIAGAKAAAQLGREALGNAADTDGLVRREPLSQREVLSILENMYDIVLNVEQLRRDQPSPEEEEALSTWEQIYSEQVQLLWDELRVMVPLETSDPHPFISLLTPHKGKKLLPRLTRHFSSQQMLTLLTLLVACFNQLDVVRQGHVLDTAESSRERTDVERQTQAFLGSVLQSILPVVAKASLRLVSGLLGLLLDRSDIVVVSRTKPGFALLTLFLSRVEVIKQGATAGGDGSEVPTAEEAQQWQMMLDHLFELLTPYFLYLFPFTRHPVPHQTPTARADQPVWQFLAALALHASAEQQQILVTILREKILEDVVIASKGWNGDGVMEDEEKAGRLNNVNLFLHALGLDSSQIAV